MNISNNSKIFFEECLVSFFLRSPSSSYIRNSIAASVMNIVLAVSGTILNSFVLFIFWKSSKLRSKVPYFSIMLLCSIDLGVVTVVHPLFALKSITIIMDSVTCFYVVAYTMAILFFSGISAWTLFIINIERYFSIIHPALHRNEFTKRRFVLTWVFFWFFVLVSISSSIYFSFLTKLISISLGIIVLTSLYTYIAIFVVARKKMLKIRNNNDQELSRNFMAFLRDLKMAKTYVLIVSLCFLCYLPTVVVSGIHNDLVHDDNTPGSVVYALDWATTLTSLNSSINCLIFFWGNRELRKEGSKILKKCFHRQEVQQFELNVVQMWDIQTWNEAIETSVCKDAVQIICIRIMSFVYPVHVKSVLNTEIGRGNYKSLTSKALSYSEFMQARCDLHANQLKYFPLQLSFTRQHMQSKSRNRYIASTF